MRSIFSNELAQVKIAAMAESYFKCFGWSLELEASAFAMCMALFRTELLGSSSKLLDVPGVSRLHHAIDEGQLHHDWYHVIKVDDVFLDDSDWNGFLELVSACIRHVHRVGASTGIHHDFYTTLGGKFTPPFKDGSDWRVVAWPLMQLASVPLARIALGVGSEHYLKALGW